ncbi:DUF1330 domain-containing protein [Variovorax sp. LjRoot290]|uniref:DUF1330 domain-containing protein n=1 Tax=Variovorax sp. LjRoot290 TaxID=3342316 RepID=UPI003ECC8023
MSGRKGYIFGDLTVTDAKYFHEEYMTRVRPVLDKYGAVFLIGQDNPTTLEGDRPMTRAVLVEFESPERAREFYQSADYQEVIGYRLRSSSTYLYLMEGVPAPLSS